MGTILLNPKNQQEFRFIQELLEKLGISSKVFTDEEMQDLGMSLLMKEVDRSKEVSEEAVMKKLQAK